MSLKTGHSKALLDLVLPSKVRFKKCLADLPIGTLDMPFNVYYALPPADN